MKNNNNFYVLLGAVINLTIETKDLLIQYKTFIVKNKEMRKHLKNIDYIYMYYIILNLSKLFSLTGADKSGLKQIKNISPKKIKEEITLLEQTNLKTIEKIQNNRNRIVAHLDISKDNSYINMGFSTIEINRKKKDILEYSKITNMDQVLTKNLLEIYRGLKSKSKKEERYSPSDFTRSIPKLTKMMEDILKITNDLSLYYYNKTK
jgi:hypothetical protein